MTENDTNDSKNDWKGHEWVKKKWKGLEIIKNDPKWQSVIMAKNDKKWLKMTLKGW